MSPPGDLLTHPLVHCPAPIPVFLLIYQLSRLHAPWPNPAGSEEEREHAEILMQYQNQRGGRVKLKSILMPEMEFNHPEKVVLEVGGCSVWGMDGRRVGRQGQWGA